MLDFELWLEFCFNVGVFGVQWHQLLNLQTCREFFYSFSQLKYDCDHGLRWVWAIKQIMSLGQTFNTFGFGLNI